MHISQTVPGIRKGQHQDEIPSFFEMAYKTPVRPLVEYSSSVWSPYTQNNIHKIEMVQRRAARWTLDNYTRQASV